jgi:hypothetical protein
LLVAGLLGLIIGQTLVGQTSQTMIYVTLAVMLVALNLIVGDRRAGKSEKQITFLAAFRWLGLMAICFNALAYGASPNPLWGWVGGIGLGLVLAIPATGKRFLWLKDHKFALFSTARRNCLDIAWRLALIVGVEFALRHMDLRYSFKASAALVTCLVFYQLWPALPKSAASDELYHRADAVFDWAIAGFGVALLLASYALSAIWLLPLVIALGVAGLTAALTAGQLTILAKNSSFTWIPFWTLLGAIVAAGSWLGGSWSAFFASLIAGVVAFVVTYFLALIDIDSGSVK